MAKAKTPARQIGFRVDWAWIDVKRGRGRLRKLIGERDDTVRNRIPITLTGYLEDIHSRDDGVSQEFAMTVTGAEFGDPIPT